MNKKRRNAKRGNLKKELRGNIRGPVEGERLRGYPGFRMLTTQSPGDDSSSSTRNTRVRKRLASPHGYRKGAARRKTGHHIVSFLISDPMMGNRHKRRPCSPEFPPTVRLTTAQDSETVLHPTCRRKWSVKCGRKILQTFGGCS